MIRAATLTLSTTFDDQCTDAESVATALDKLLETALSTPDILDEYGNPTFGEFDVVPARAELIRMKNEAILDPALQLRAARLELQLADSFLGTLQAKRALVNTISAASILAQFTDSKAWLAALSGTVDAGVIYKALAALMADLVDSDEAENGESGEPYATCAAANAVLKKYAAQYA